MNVFIMWSGSASKKVGMALRTFLQAVVQRPEYFISTDDIDTGAVWANVIAGQLETTHFGIACLTRENLDSQWIHFEAGAISKVSVDATVVPYLVGLDPTELAGPLTKFQATIADSDGTRSLAQAINNALPESDRTDVTALETVFQALWPDVQRVIQSVAENGNDPPQSLRSQDDILREILTRLRRMEMDSSRDWLPRSKQSEFQPIDVSLEGMIILWVDDSPENNSTLIRRLAKAGAEVVTELSTKAALARLDDPKQHFNVIITDMGRGDSPKAGLELLELLASRRFGGAKFVYSTSQLAHASQSEIRELGAVGPLVGHTAIINEIIRIASRRGA